MLSRPRLDGLGRLCHSIRVFRKARPTGDRGGLVNSGQPIGRVVLGVAIDRTDLPRSGIGGNFRALLDSRVRTTTCGSDVLERDTRVRRTWGGLGEPNFCVTL